MILVSSSSQIYITFTHNTLLLAASGAIVIVEKYSQLHADQMLLGVV